MTKQDKLELIKLLEIKNDRVLHNKLFIYYPDQGPLRRELYQKHLEFFKAGQTYAERLAMAGNRVGKTEGMGGYEMALHITGLYPDWWEGKCFDRPVKAWAAGDTSKTVRDIIQQKLLGEPNEFGTGLIPKHTLLDTTSKQGTPDAVDTIYVKHIAGGTSTIQLKSYDQKRKSFQGTKKDIIWLDEEPPLDIYTECLLRTMDTTGLDTSIGIVMLTFTPLLGMSEVVLSYLPNGELEEKCEGSKHVTMASWDDVPHLSTKVKEALLKSIPPFQRDARSKGIPQLGAGAIYPVQETDVFIDDFPIPKHWPKAYALDVGWNRTACIWMAHDRESDIIYFWSEHYRGEAEPSIHAKAINARGKWIKGVVDPAARGRSQKDGEELKQNYIDLGLDLENAFNGVESGLLECWERMSTGRIKIFNSLVNTKMEFRLYRRDEKGRIVKKMDHLMDTMRYAVMSGLEVAIVEPVAKKPQNLTYSIGSMDGSWMG